MQSLANQIGARAQHQHYHLVDGYNNHRHQQSYNFPQAGYSDDASEDDELDSEE